MSREDARGHVVVFSRAGDFIVTVNLTYTVFLDIGYSFSGPEPIRISGLHWITKNVFLTCKCLRQSRRG